VHEPASAGHAARWLLLLPLAAAGCCCRWLLPAAAAGGCWRCWLLLLRLSPWHQQGVSGGAQRSSDLVERLHNVVPDVLHALHAAAEAHQVVLDAVLGALLGALAV
jgi:hypothetical protein